MYKYFHEPQCTSFNLAATVRAMLKVIAKVIGGLVNRSSRSTIEAEPTLNFLTARKVACTVQLCNGPCSPNGITRYKTSRKVDLPCEYLLPTARSSIKQPVENFDQRNKKRCTYPRNQACPESPVCPRHG